MKKLTQKRLKELLEYDPETGIFIRRITTSSRSQKGSRAGCLDTKGRYIVITLDSRAYLAHRLAWLYMIGEWPNQIDHINRDRSDNRWINLRNTNYTGNRRNRPARGYMKVRNKYRVRVGDGRGGRILIGWFVTEEEAKRAYLSAIAKYYGEFSWS